MSDWYEGIISRSEPAAAGLHAIHVDVGRTPLRGTHVLPGQYVHVRLSDEEVGLFAIASPPAPVRDEFELLVKQGTAHADALIISPVGTKILLSAPEGKGFDLTRAYGKRTLLFATGSGISAIRSLIQAIIAERAKFGDVTLYFGARTPDAFAYEDETKAWEAAGIQVVRTVSQAQASGWKGLTGYVQGHLQEEPLWEAVAFLCGQDSMVNGVTRALRVRGMSAENIFLNF